MKKVILIVLDGLSADTAFSTMGYLEHITEIGVASRYKVRTELPTLSRPLYEVLMTGVPVYEHEVVSNEIRRMSKEKSIFSLAREKNLITAAAAYGWISELYNKAPFTPEDRFQLDVERQIQHGIFYFEDMYPDSHLFSDAEFLRAVYNPDLLLIHSMNIDYEGHRVGYDGDEYTYSTAKADMILSYCLKTWIQEGYAVLITADHGMNKLKMHNGTSNEERFVPLYIAGISARLLKQETEFVPQLAIAPLVCKLLNIEKSSKMLQNDIFKILEG